MDVINRFRSRFFFFVLVFRSPCLLSRVIMVHWLLRL